MTNSALKKKKNIESLQRVLREKVRPKHLAVCMTDRNYNFFFVDTGEDGPNWVPKNLHDDMLTLLSRHVVPAYETLLNLKKEKPVSAEEILKLDSCLSAYGNNSNAMYTKELKKDGWNNGLPDNSVVPCLYILDRRKARTFTDPNGTVVTEVIFDHYFKGIPDGELGTYLSRTCGSLDGREVEDVIKSRCLDGTKTKEVRVSSVIAHGVVDFLNSKHKGLSLTVEDIFKWSPSRGEKSGKRTEAIRVADGNVLPDLKAAKDYPQD